MLKLFSEDRILKLTVLVIHDYKQISSSQIDVLVCIVLESFRRIMYSSVLRKRRTHLE